MLFCCHPNFSRIDMSMDSLVTKEILKAHDGPEIIFGLVGPVGTKLRLVVQVLEEQLEKVGYRSKAISVSSLLHQLDKYSYLTGLAGGSEYDRIKEHMGAGTDLRQLTGRGDIMALLSVGEMRRLRAMTNEESMLKGEHLARKPLHRTAYILRSLKHPDEIDTLRDIYGGGIFVISAYAPREDRIETLAQHISRSQHQFDRANYRSQSEELINIDEKEEKSALGQDVSDAFPLADLFIDARHKESIEKSIKRFLEALFDYPYHTPIRDEYAMFHAKSAAIRSADLSRQVGAVIATEEGDIVAVGCNEVPKASGGLYWAEDVVDARDFRVGYDSSARFKQDILAELLARFSSGGWFADDKSKMKISELLERLLIGEDRTLVKDAQIMNLLEFGRTVHAEMAAITDAARRGVSVKGATLYSTTFPCHLCARHIIASGITRVVYVEPYPKSMAKELYSDSITVDPSTKISDRVCFEPFVGISPRSYMSLFESRIKRKKDSGAVVSWDGIESNPRFKRFTLSYLLVEEKIVGEFLPDILKQADLKPLGKN